MIYELSSILNFYSHNCEILTNELDLYLLFSSFYSAGSAVYSCYLREGQLSIIITILLQFLKFSSLRSLKDHSWDLT